MIETGQGKTKRICTIWDPGVRWSMRDGDGGVDAKVYARDRDESIIESTPGGRPTWFITKRLRRSEMVLIEDTYGDAARRAAAFSCGVVAIERPDGQTIKPSAKRWTSEELDELCEHAEVEEIGMVVLSRSRVPLDWPAAYALPPSSLDAWASQAFRFAEQSPIAAEPSSSKHEEQSVKAE